MEEYWGYHMLLDIKGAEKDIIKSKDRLTEFVKALVKKIDMKAYGEPIIEHFATHNPKAAGYSLLQLIETSSITGHFVDDNGDAYLDIFSCKTFKKEDVLSFVETFFKPEDINYKFLTRSARSKALI